MSREQNIPSRPTHTALETPPTISGTLRLRGHHRDERRVAWTENTVDNEKLGRKSSKICCIYHKPKKFDESSEDDSSSSDDSADTGDEHDDPRQKRQKSAPQEKCCEPHAAHQSTDKSPLRNGYEKA